MRFRQLPLLCLALLIALGLSACGDPGVVRVSPDGRYTTVVRPLSDRNLELALHDLETNETTPILRLTRPDPDDGRLYPAFWVTSCQWRPDSRAVSFLLYTEDEQALKHLVEQKDLQTHFAESSERQSALAVLLYELGSQKLQRLPVELPIAAVWSRDGKHLLVYHLKQEHEQPMVSVYRTDTWVRVGAFPLPEGYYHEIVSWEWATLLSQAPLTAIVYLGETVYETNGWVSSREGSLYLMRNGQWMPLTTTNDVQAYWVDATGSKVRWVRVEESEFLVVFERRLLGGAPTRIFLITPEADLGNLGAKEVCDEAEYYRFSPSGDKLAWYNPTGFYVLNLNTGKIRRLLGFYPKGTTQGTVSEYDTASIVGFDWRDNETLVIQRGKELELVSVRRLGQ
ncbi:MAG: hypothetical protein RMK45_06130 [Armatimonadota bacterium]|nr:hypothetical protein [Armatimonadota bacterium]